MTARQLIAALLSILLLAGGSVVGTASGQSSHADLATAVAAGCAGLSHEASGPGSEGSGNCSELQQSYCRVNAPNCSITSLYGPITDSPAIPRIISCQFTPPLARTAHQNHISEVATPPPDSLA